MPQSPEPALAVARPQNFDQFPGKDLAEFWSKAVKTTSYTLIIPKVESSSWSSTVFTARGVHFAGCVPMSISFDHLHNRSYGLLFRGTIGQGDGIHLSELDSDRYDPWENGTYTGQKLVSLAFDEYRRLLAVLRCCNDKNVWQYTIVAWDMETLESCFGRISPILDSPHGAKAVLSRNCLFLAYQKQKGSVVVLNINKSCNEVTTIQITRGSLCKQIVWSENSKQLLLCHGRTIQIFSIPDGSSIYLTNQLALDRKIDLGRLNFFFSGSNHEIVIVHGSNLPNPGRRQERHQSLHGYPRSGLAIPTLLYSLRKTITSLHFLTSRPMTCPSNMSGRRA